MKKIPSETRFQIRILVLVAFVVATVLVTALLASVYAYLNNPVSFNPPSVSKLQDFGNDNVTVNVRYMNGKYYYNGSVIKPSPCYTFSHSASLNGSDQVQIDLLLTSVPGRVCAQVLSEEMFDGSIIASSDSEVVVFLNGKQIDKH